MNKLLPKTSRTPHGFTLIELLITISILAVLAVIGITIFGNVQKNARDAKRKADIGAISNSMEAQYSDSSGQYLALATTMFSGGVIPTDPSTGSSVCGTGNTVVCKYCNRATAGECAGTDVTVAAGAPAAGATYQVCTNLENGTTRYYCRSNQR